MSSIIAHPVTPAMGTREAFDAMLNHVAWSDSMGYGADAVNASNYRSLLRDFPTVVESTYERMGTHLQLVARISDSALLAYLLEVLTGLCNDYPLYDEEDHSALEDERLREYVELCRTNNDPATDAIVRAVYELGDFDYRDGGADMFISEGNWARAIEYALTNR